MAGEWLEFNLTNADSSLNIIFKKVTIYSPSDQPKGLRRGYSFTQYTCGETI